MSDYPDLERHRFELDKCVTCAICHSVCPSYLLSKRELLSPRGRIILLRRILEGDISAHEVSPDSFDFCTLCYACQTACPAGVRTDLLFIAARKIITDYNGISKVKKRIFESLENRKKVNTLVSLGSLTQKTIGNKAVESLAGGMTVPKLRSKPFLNELPELIEPAGTKKARVALFLGCVSNYVNENAAKASIEVMRQLGAEIVIPRNQLCCGAPAFNNGDFETARKLAKANLAIIKETRADYIVSPDATCGGAFRQEIPELLAEDEQFDMAVYFADRTLDWSSFVLDVLDPSFPSTTDHHLDVTIHDSCHITHTQHTQGNLRELLERVPGVNVVEMEESTICCGFGGSFASVYPDESNTWTTRKVEHVQKTGASYVIASSPGCIQQMERGFTNKHVGNVKVLHPAELITMRCGWMYR